MAAAQLKVVERFSVNGAEYAPETLIPVTDTVKWPDGSLPRRLENGFVVYVAVEDEDEPKLEKPAKK